MRRSLPVVLMLAARLAAAQTPAAADGAPRVAVVLSGGSARGLAHIGVLRVLEQEGIVPDIVAGASMGALVGGLYAIGYSPATLDSIVTGLEWSAYFSDVPERRFLTLDRRFMGDRTLLELPLEHGRVALPTGLISGQRISELLSRLTWSAQTERDFRRLPKTFVATATDIETGEAVVLHGGSLAAALRASMSIPSLFAPVRLDGRMLVDGGISRNLPARDARALGADVVVCSDVSNPLFPASRLKSLLDVLLQTMTIYMNSSTVAERPSCDIYVQPSTEGMTGADFDRAAEWIRRGEDAASAQRPALAALAGRLAPGAAPRHPTPAPRGPLPRSVRVARVVVEGVDGAAARAIRQRLRIGDGDVVAAERLDAATKRVYATELFDQVHYRLDARGADTVLVVTADAREQDRVGLGLRYDDVDKASLLFTARLRNRIGFGSTTQLDLRLGEQLRAAVRHVNVGVAGSRYAVGASASHDRASVPLYEGDDRIAEARVEVSGVVALLGVLLGERGAAGIELKGEHVRAATTIAPDDRAARRTFASGAVVARWHTLDRSVFPTRGGSLSLRSERAIGGGDPFWQHAAHGLVAWPVARRLTALGRATVGASSPVEQLPLHYRFLLGGAYPAPLFPETQVAFPGLRRQERSGAAVARAGAGLQWEPRRNLFATARGDVGYVGRTLTLERDEYAAGLALALGALTPIGPVELSAGWRPGHGDPRLELSLGHPF